MKALEKKPKVVVTGSEGLLGRVVAKHLAEHFEVIGLDMKLGHNLTDEKFVADWFKKNSGLYGIIICHAYNPVPQLGGKKVEPKDTPLQEIREYLEVNVVSPFSLIQQFVKYNEGGRIVTLSSIYGTVSPRHDFYENFTKHPGYSLTKGALAVMTKYLAAYYAPNFLINTVVLGGVTDNKIDPEFRKRYEANIPMKRMMKPEEILPMFDFLLDPKNTYTTGAEILCDGGWTAW